MSVAIRCLGLVASLAAFVASAAPSLAQDGRDTPSCSLGETDWRSHPVFLASQHPSARGHQTGELRCRVSDMFQWQIDGEPLTLTRARIFESAGGSGNDVQQAVNLFIFARGSGERTRIIGRFLEPYDVSLDSPQFFSRTGRIDQGTLVQLDRRVRTAYLIAGDDIRPIDSQAWLDMLGTVVPAGWVAGPVRNVELAAMKGYVSLFRASADDPASPGRASDDGQAVEVDLTLSHGKLIGRQARVVQAHFAQTDEEWTGFVSDAESMRLQRRHLPPGTETCDIAAWSADPDPAGLPLRAAPEPQARLIGRIPPPWKAPDRQGDEGSVYRSQFRVVGYRNGWFLVRDISAPGVAYGERYPRNMPQAPRGQGWVQSRLVGAALANGAARPGLLHQAPSEFSASRQVLRAGTAMGAGDTVERLHACSGAWSLVDIGGQRGWWRGICANQVTNCS
jgi:hypothetical protein